MSERWWLISYSDIEIVRAALQAPTHLVNDYNCPDDWDDCRGCNGDETRERARHILDSGLHVTDAVPSDFEEVRDE